MDYTITEATVNNVQTIVNVTFQSFEDAFNKSFYLKKLL